MLVVDFGSFETTRHLSEFKTAAETNFGALHIALSLPIVVSVASSACGVARKRIGKFVDPRLDFPISVWAYIANSSLLREPGPTTCS